MIEWQINDGHSLSLVGELSSNTLANLMPIEPNVASFSQHLSVELSTLTQVDSAGLAFLIELSEICRARNLRLDFCGTTPALDRLISLYNAKSLLDNNV